MIVQERAEISISACSAPVRNGDGIDVVSTPNRRNFRRIDTLNHIIDKLFLTGDFEYFYVFRIFTSMVQNRSAFQRKQKVTS